MSRRKYESLARADTRSCTRSLTRVARRWPLLQILFGAAIGMTIAGLFRWESLSDVEEKIMTVVKSHDDALPIPSMTLRCIIIIQRATSKPDAFASAISAGWAKRCNQTTFYTNSLAIAKQIKDYHVVHLDDTSGPSYWDFYRRVLEHASRTPVSWTIIGDEQLYVIVENLRKALAVLEPNKPVVVGRVRESNSAVSWLFPLIGWRSISTEAGVVISSRAMPMLLQDCPAALFEPRSTARALFYCANALGVQIVDPVDEDGQHLFHEKDIKYLVGGANMDHTHAHGGHDFGATCCSEHAATFGTMTFKQQRVAEYVTYHMQVFGGDGISIYNHTTTVAPTTPAKKKEEQKKDAKKDDKKKEDKTKKEEPKKAEEKKDGAKPVEKKDEAKKDEEKKEDEKEERLEEEKKADDGLEKKGEKLT